MNLMKKLFQKQADAAHSEQRGTFTGILATFGVCMVVLFVMMNGCDTKNESANASGNDNPEKVPPSAETQKAPASQEQPQPVEADSSISQEAQKSQTKDQAGIKVTFVELGSVNCIPCKMMQPIMKEIEKEYKNQVKVVFHDVWTEQGRPYAEKFGIRVIPTQVFLDRDGIEYFRHEGFFQKEQLVEVLRKQGVN